LQGLLLDRPIPDVILDEDISLVDMQVTTNVSIDGDCHQSDQGVKNLGFYVSHEVVVWDDDVEEVLNELTWDEEWVQEVESVDAKCAPSAKHTASRTSWLHTCSNHKTCQSIFPEN
jgi:hypothetical protein